MPQGRQTIEAENGVTISVRTVGNWRPVLLIPSMGRGVGDYDAVAQLPATGRR